MGGNTTVLCSQCSSTRQGVMYAGKSPGVAASQALHRHQSHSPIKRTKLLAMKALLASLVTSHLLICACGTKWTPATFPNPSTPEGAKLCGREVLKSRICDPDHIISVAAANTVEGILKDIENAVEPYASDRCKEKVSGVSGFEVAVALIDEMQLDGLAPEQAAADFAERLFDVWGIGQTECNNGVLLLLAKHERQVYIRGGKQALKVAPGDRLQVVIEGMKPHLRSGDYAKAVELGVVDLGLVLAGADPSHHSDDGWDGGIIFFWLIFGGIISFIAWGIGRKEMGQRRCRKLLDKLRDEQAFAQQNKAYPAKSCPVCFEDLKEALPAPPSGDPGTNKSDGKEPRAANRQSDVSNPLLDRNEAGSSHHAQEGKERLTLPCGHAFCDPCISEWFDKHNSCPICRKKVEGADEAPTSSSSVADLDPDMYAMEVHYRMNRLHRSYPYWVTPTMVNTADEACRAGQVMDWNAVRQSQLSSASHAQHQSAGQWGSSHGFGGGTSSGGGGVGGSW